MGCSPRVDVVIKQVTAMAKMAHKLSKAEFWCKVSKFLRYLESEQNEQMHIYGTYIFTYIFMVHIYGTYLPNVVIRPRGQIPIK